MDVLHRIRTTAWLPLVVGAHLCWAWAAFVDVRTGRRYSAGWCDDTYANGDNGPYGYGQNQGASNTITALLIAGLVLMLLAVAVSSRERRPLVGLNALLGGVAAAMVFADVIGQIENNPYCTVAGVRRTQIGVGVALVVVTALNFVYGRRPRPEVTPTRRPT